MLVVVGALMVLIAIVWFGCSVISAAWSTARHSLAAGRLAVDQDDVRRTAYPLGLLVIGALMTIGGVVEAVRSSDRESPSQRPALYVGGDEPWPDDHSSYGDDSDYGSCVGDCTDSDDDGRTYDDVDADGDGLYETP